MIRIFAVCLLALIGAVWIYRRDLSFPPPALIMPDAYAVRVISALPITARDGVQRTPELQHLDRAAPDTHNTAVLEKKLPATFPVPSDLEHAIDAIQKEMKVLLLVDWDALAIGGVEKATPVKVEIGGNKLGDAISDVLRAADPAHHSLCFTIYKGTISISSRRAMAPLVVVDYNISDLIIPPSGTRAASTWSELRGLKPAKRLATDFQARLGEHWDQTGAITINMGTFRVAQPLETQLLLDRLIVRQRWYKRHVTLLARMAAIIVPVILLAIVIEIALAYRLAYRRRLMGCCVKCEYDLRATPDRCPECGGTPVA